MEIKNKMNDLNEADQEDNNYMDDGELDQNEEQQIEQQIEEEEQPAIMELRKEINGDKFIIDRNGKKIKLYDREEEEKKKRRKEKMKIFLLFIIYKVVKNFGVIIYITINFNNNDR